MREIDPLCALDFYVVEACQRQGIGNRLFEFMLHVRGVVSVVSTHVSSWMMMNVFVNRQREGVGPSRLGYDRPSSKFLAFLAKHYGLKDYTPQTNNFVVYRQYFQPSTGVDGACRIVCDVCTGWCAGFSDDLRSRVPRGGGSITHSPITEVPPVSASFGAKSGAWRDSPRTFVDGPPPVAPSVDARLARAVGPSYGVANRSGDGTDTHSAAVQAAFGGSRVSPSAAGSSGVSPSWLGTRTSPRISPSHQEGEDASSRVRRATFGRRSGSGGSSHSMNPSHTFGAASAPFYTEPSTETFHTSMDAGLGRAAKVTEPASVPGLGPQGSKTSPRSLGVSGRFAYRPPSSRPF